MIAVQYIAVTFLCNTYMCVIGLDNSRTVEGQDCCLDSISVAPIWERKKEILRNKGRTILKKKSPEQNPSSGKLFM